MADDAAENTETGEESTDGAVDSNVESTEDINYSDLADQDFGTALAFGAVPLVIFGVLLVIAVGIYFTRKKNAWSDSELEDLKDDDDGPANSEVEFPTTTELSKMDETEPAKKL